VRRLLGPEELKFWLFDRRAPCNVVVCARIEGSVDPEAVAHALGAVSRRHPLLRCRVEDRPRVRFAEASDAAIPLRRVARTNDTQWQMECERELGSPLPLDRGPLARAVLVHGPAVSDLVLCASHAATDALGMVSLARDVMAAMAGDEQPALPPGPAFEELIADDEFASADDSRLRNWWWSRAAAAALEALSWDEIAARLPPIGSTRIVNATLTPAQSDALTNRCRAEQTTVHGAIAAAALIGLAGAAERTLTCVHSIDLRRRLNPPVGDDLGLFVSHVATRHDVGREHGLWALAQAVRREVDRAVDRGDAFGNVLGVARLLRGQAGIGLEPPPDLTLTNIGRLASDSRHGALSLAAVRHFGSIMLDAPSVTAATIAGQLSVFFTFPTTWPRRDEAEDIAAALRARLCEACT
jgi:hypothetical protein